MSKSIKNLNVFNICALIFKHTFFLSYKHIILQQQSFISSSSTPRTSNQEGFFGSGTFVSMKIILTIIVHHILHRIVFNYNCAMYLKQYYLELPRRQVNACRRNSFRSIPYEYIGSQAVVHEVPKTKDLFDRQELHRRMQFPVI